MHRKLPQLHFQRQETLGSTCEIGSQFDENYRLDQMLGQGAFSTVREAVSRSDGFVYAVKCVNRNKITIKEEESMVNGAEILYELQHTHILRLHDFFMEPNKCYLVMERARGGDLFDRIVAKGHFTEQEAISTCIQLLRAVEYLHDHRVAHRDLKPDNVLLSSPQNGDDSDSILKIADFGFATKVEHPYSLRTMCGTLGYMAPEILQKRPYDERADMWSVGVILYMLLSGSPPIYDESGPEMYRKNCLGVYGFYEPVWNTTSSEAKNLISSLLTIDPLFRLSASQALESPWILQGSYGLLCNKKNKKCVGNAKSKTMKLFHVERNFHNNFRSIKDSLLRRGAKVYAS